MSMLMPVADYCAVCGSPTRQASINGKNRPQCSACGHVVYFDPKVAAIALILHDERILLAQRAHDPNRGKWVLPGGFVDYGEHPQDAVRREVLEETHLTVEVGKLIDVFHTSGGTTITIAYHAQIIEGVARADDDVQAIGWFTRESIPELCFISTITVVDRWMKGLLP